MVWAVGPEPPESPRGRPAWPRRPAPSAGAELQPGAGAFRVQGGVDSARHVTGAPGPVPPGRVQPLGVAPSPVLWAALRVSPKQTGILASPQQALSGVPHPRRVLSVSPFQVCSAGRTDSPLLDQVRLASWGMGGRGLPQTLPPKPGADPRLGRDCPHTPAPHRLVGSGLATLARTPAPLGTPRGAPLQ